MLLTVLLVLPALNSRFAVKVKQQDAAMITQAPLPDKPENVPVTVYYIMEENSKKISALYIEVLQIATNTLFYMEIPVDTKVDLSEELYKSLQTYGPELPQHFKLANMAESFSEEYRLTAANRILSEVLDFSVTEYVKATDEEFRKRPAIKVEEITPSVFFEAYSEWVKSTMSSRTVEERWSYYENRLRVTDMIMEIAPGSREKDGYLISSKRTKERLEEIIHKTEGQKEE